MTTESTRRVEATSPSTSTEHSGGFAHSARLVIGTLLLAALVVFGVDNRKTVKVSWVVGNGTAPLAVVLALAAVAGALVGWLYLHRPHHTSR